LTLATLWVVIGWSATSKSAAHFLYACCYVPSLQLMHTSVVWVFALLYAMCGEVGLFLNHLLLMVDYQLALVDGCLPSNDESVDSLYLFVRGKNDSLSDMPSESLRTPSKRSCETTFISTPEWEELMTAATEAHQKQGLSDRGVKRVLDLSKTHSSPPQINYSAEFNSAVLHWVHEDVPILPPSLGVWAFESIQDCEAYYEEQWSCQKRQFQDEELKWTLKWKQKCSLFLSETAKIEKVFQAKGEENRQEMLLSHKKQTEAWDSLKNQQMFELLREQERQSQLLEAHFKKVADARATFKRPRN